MSESEKMSPSTLDDFVATDTDFYCGIGCEQLPTFVRIIYDFQNYTVVFRGSGQQIKSNLSK